MLNDHNHHNMDDEPDDKVTGLEPIPEDAKPCSHQEHNPPMHLMIPPGYQYRHKCPGCKAEQLLRNPEVKLEKQPDIDPSYWGLWMRRAGAKPVEF